MFKGEAVDKAIAAFWHAADEVGGNAEIYTKLMLLMGKRRTALSMMRWEEVDSTGYWSAPKSDSNKKLFGQPLSALARRVLGPHQQRGPVFGDLGRRDIDRLQDKKLSSIEGERELFAQHRTNIFATLPKIRPEADTSSSF